MTVPARAPDLGWLYYAIIGLLIGIALFCLPPTDFLQIAQIAKLFDPRCSIKGNISYSGERIYHVPGQKYYSGTVIRWSRGERWFCSETDAVAAGWRKAKL